MSTTIHPDFDHEQAFLRHAHHCLEEMGKNVEKLGDATGDPKAASALASMKKRMLERLQDPESVCFGRLDFDQGDQIYVGRQMVVDGKDNLIVINWAAPAATPFFEATPEDPLTLAMRRRFRTDRDELLGISDEVFSAEGVAEPTIGDILLEELSRERTAEMRDIAATIQRDQYRIISKPLESTTIVQGGPGTGKTAVGLQRAALLLFRHRTMLAPSRVLVVGPNPLFMQYIAYVLPSLGETAADQLAVEALGQIASSTTDDNLVALVKGDGRMADVLRLAVVDRVRAPVDNIPFTIGGLQFDVPAAPVAELTRGFDPRETPYNVGRDRFRVGFEREVARAYSAASRERGAGSESLDINVRTRPEFVQAFDRIWPSMTAADLVRQLLSSEDRLERAGLGLTEPERRLLYRRPVDRLDQVVWTGSDVALVDEVQQMIEPVARRYGHVVVDEAQDLTPMQLRMVGRRIREGSATVLGDLAQATGLWSYDTWHSVASHLGLADEMEVEELTHAYRVPSEIMDLALPVLALTAPSISPPKAFRETGEHPSFVQVSRLSRAGEAVTYAVAAHETGGTAVIIAPPSCLGEVREELETRGIDFGDAVNGSLGETVELLDAISVKGLEFDHVVILEPGAIIREAESRGHQALYVALTRAMKTLTCIHSEQLPWPLNQYSEPITDKSSAVVQPAYAFTAASPVATQPSAVAAVTPEASAPPPLITVSEALVIARLRGINLNDALSRALIISASGGNEDAVVAVLLGSTTLDSDRVKQLIDIARGVGS